jgi:RHS repeat-associated protein
MNNKPYRYGFNGKENDNDVKQDFDGNGIPGSQQDYGMRIYDPRVGRFLSTDPFSKSYPYLTSYQFASNKPINSIDVDGAEAMEIIHWLANTATSRQTAQQVAARVSSIFHINEKQTMFAFGIYNGIISGADAIGLNEQYKKYSNQAIKQLFSMHYNTFMQEDLSFDKVKKLIPELSMAEDSYNGIRNAINEAYAGDPYSAGQIFGMCLTANIGGLDADGILALRGLGGKGTEAAEILEAYVPKQNLTNSPKFDPNKPALKNANLDIASSRNGNAPDFNGTPHLYVTQPGELNIVNVRLTGSYSGDFFEANAAAHLKETPTGYMWHHLDDFNSNTGKATLQLVKKDVHTKTIPYTGSVKQYENTKGTTYKR